VQLAYLGAPELEHLMLDQRLFERRVRLVQLSGLLISKPKVEISFRELWLYARYLAIRFDGLAENSRAHGFGALLDCLPNRLALSNLPISRGQ